MVTPLKKHNNQFKMFMVKIFLPLVMLLLLFLLVFTHFFEQKIILGSEICGAYKINRNINQNYPDEIPIFGSSRAQYSFIPDSLGKNFFNYGMDGVGFNVTLMMLEEECKKKKNEPLIVVNFDLEGLYSALGDLSNYLYNVSYPSVKEVLGEEYKTHYSIPVIKYYSQFEMYSKYYLNARMQLTKITNKGASLEKNILPEKKFNEMVEVRQNSVTSFANEPKLEQRLKIILEKNPNRKFAFVIPPNHPSFFESFSNMPTAHKFLAELDALSNVRVFDFSSEIYPDSMFLNTSHINYKGALIFNKKLKDSLATFR